MDFEPEQPEDGLLYHYCDVVAFESIIRTNNLWLSPFRHSNDSEEGIRAEKLLVRLARIYGLTEGQATQFGHVLEGLSIFNDCYGLCLSKEGDLLSQWRGYAADGAGFAIGFNQSMLSELPPFHLGDVPAEHVRGPVLHQVAYDEADQIREMAPWFESMKELIQKSEQPSPKQIVSDLMSDKLKGLPSYMSAKQKLKSTLRKTWDRLYMVKGEAFSEEREWRLVVTTSQLLREVPFQFRVSRGKIVPFLEYSMPKRSSNLSPISHIYLGPKNHTPRYVVQMMLSRFGLDDVTICNSKASYQ